MKQYFLNFPSINYQGFAATNIMERVAFVEQYKADYRLFYTYVVPDGVKAERLAQDVYGDPNYVWVVYMFNNIIDPYYQWPLSQLQFEDYITDKYGSFPNAATQIKYYQNNYANDPSTLTLSGYTALPSNLRKYWRPKLAPGNKVTYYTRAQLDTIVSAVGGLPSDEQPYFSSVSLLDWETQENEAKANIKLLKPSFLSAVETALKQELQQ